MYYSYAMGVSARYADSIQDAAEITNDGFMKVFTYLKKFDRKKEFKPWFRRILINCAIDNYKKNYRKSTELDIHLSLDKVNAESQIDLISYDEMLQLIRELPPGYRAVFNLYAIEGYKHNEIAEILNISGGTSKSNYFKAKKKLQEKIHLFFEVD